MGGFSGIPKIASQFDALGNRIGRTSGELKKVAEDSFKALENIGKVQKAAESAGSQLAKLNKELEKSGAHAEQGSLAGSEAGAMTGVTVMRGTIGLAPGELFSIEQLNQLGQRILDTGPGKKYAESLEDISSRIKALMGPDNYIAKLIEVEIPYLRKGARSAEEATAFVQSVLIPFVAAFQRELANPTTPADVRSMLQELIHLAQSGSAYQQYTSESQKRAADERKRQDDIREILATDRHNKTKAQLDELDKRLKDLQDGQKQTTEHAKNAAAAVQVGGGIAKVNQTIAEAAAEQKKFRDEFMAEQKKRADEIKQKMKEAADQEKKDAEALRQSMGQFASDLLHGGYAGVAITLSDDIERRLLHGG